MFKSFFFYIIFAVQVTALPRNYQSLSAEEKQGLLYDECVATSDDQDSGPGLTDILALLTRDLSPVFENDSDERPWWWWGGKPIHAVGYVAKAKFEAIDNPFTGAFDGSQHLLMRLSLAAPASEDETAPGLAIKFLRSSMRSGNLFAMFSLEGQDSTDFFENDFANHVNPEESFLLRTVAVKFARSTPHTNFVGLSDLASFDDNGNEIQEPAFPFLVVLKPNPELSMTVDQITSIGPDTLLYEVWAQSEPEDEDLIRLGDISTTSEFVGSTWGDQNLFFQHQKMEDDIALKPEWSEYLSDEALLRCPFTN